MLNMNQPQVQYERPYQLVIISWSNLTPAISRSISKACPRDIKFKIVSKNTFINMFEGDQQTELYNCVEGPIALLYCPAKELIDCSVISSYTNLIPLCIILGQYVYPIDGLQDSKINEQVYKSLIAFLVYNLNHLRLILLQQLIQHLILLVKLAKHVNLQSTNT